jgi:L-asparaginase
MRRLLLLLTSSVILLTFAVGIAAAKPRIAVFSGPTATIQNSEPLITSNKARAAHSLPLLTGTDGQPLPFDRLFAQRIAAPATVYVEMFTAHPLEADVAELYAAPDGYVNASGAFSVTRSSPADKPVYAVTLRPEDGLYPLPYMGLQQDGSAWDSTATRRGAPFSESRQTFYPNAARILEEIERNGGAIYALADYDFYRPAPAGGYTKGLPASARTDFGTGDIPPEALGEDFFTYGPYGASGSRQHLARATNVVQATLATGDYDGAFWLEGSPSVEDTIYWLGLLIDTDKPLIGNAAQRMRGLISADGDANIVDSINYIVSRVWADADGHDRVGAIMIQDQQIFNAREVQKGDARPGGYVTTGGHGGVVGSTDYGPRLSFLSVRRSTHRSDLKLPLLPASVPVVVRSDRGLTRVPYPTKDSDDKLIGSAMPNVTFVKSSRWQTTRDATRDATSEVAILAQLNAFLQSPGLAGIVNEGLAPYGSAVAPIEAALDVVALSGFPVAQAARGDAHGYMQANTRNLRIEANNMTSTKARILLMACLLKFGALPPAQDPLNPSEDELNSLRSAYAAYQAVFDTH